VTCNFWLEFFLLHQSGFFFVASGSVDKGVVEVTNCFCVPHIEHDDQVDAELNYALDLYELNRRVNPSENIVGKYVDSAMCARSTLEMGKCSLRRLLNVFSFSGRMVGHWS
jgi:hypothetical protein